MRFRSNLQVIVPDVVSSQTSRDFAGVKSLILKADALRFSPDLRGRLGFDGVGEAVAACPGLLSPGKTLGKISTANNNLALAA